ncbi:MAG: hypothetical protein ACPG7F_08115 [Aggregatilineales bacterium]
MTVKLLYNQNQAILDGEGISPVHRQEIVRHSRKVSRNLRGSQIGRFLVAALAIIIPLCGLYMLFIALNTLSVDDYKNTSNLLWSPIEILYVPFSFIAGYILFKTYISSVRYARLFDSESIYSLSENYDTGYGEVTYVKKRFYYTKVYYKFTKKGRFPRILSFETESSRQYMIGDIVAVMYNDRITILL